MDRLKLQAFWEQGQEADHGSGECGSCGGSSVHCGVLDSRTQAENIKDDEHLELVLLEAVRKGDKSKGVTFILGTKPS